MKEGCGVLKNGQSFCGNDCLLGGQVPETIYVRGVI